MKLSHTDCRSWTSPPPAPHRTVRAVFPHTAHRRASPFGSRRASTAAHISDETSQAERPVKEQPVVAMPALITIPVLATQPDTHLRAGETVHLDEVRRGVAVAKVPAPAVQRHVHHADELARDRAERHGLRPLFQARLDALDCRLARTPQGEHPAGAVAGHPAHVEPEELETVSCMHEAALVLVQPQAERFKG